MDYVEVTFYAQDYLPLFQQNVFCEIQSLDTDLIYSVCLLVNLALC